MVRSKSWIQLIGMILIYYFLSCLIAILYFNDNGECQLILDQTDCENKSNLGHIFTHQCYWLDTSESCYFRPILINIYEKDNNVIQLLLLLGIVLVLGEVLNMILKVLINYSFPIENYKPSQIPDKNQVFEKPRKRFEKSGFFRY
jgi:hypothetical protein